MSCRDEPTDLALVIGAGKNPKMHCKKGDAQLIMCEESMQAADLDNDYGDLETTCWFIVNSGCIEFIL